jgi:hypothetical protein
VHFDIVLRQFGQSVIFEAPPTLLGKQRRGEVRLTINDLSCRTYASRLQNGEVAVIVPRALLHRLNLSEGQCVGVDLEACNHDGWERVPPDLQTALDKAGRTLAMLPIFEQRQLVSLVREASDPEIRQSRIEAVLRVCHDRLTDKE